MTNKANSQRSLSVKIRRTPYEIPETFKNYIWLFMSLHPRYTASSHDRLTAKLTLNTNECCINENNTTEFSVCKRTATDYIFRRQTKRYNSNPGLHNTHLASFARTTYPRSAARLSNTSARRRKVGGGKYFVKTSARISFEETKINTISPRATHWRMKWYFTWMWSAFRVISGTIVRRCAVAYSCHGLANK